MQKHLSSTFFRSYTHNCTRTLLLFCTPAPKANKPLLSLYYYYIALRPPNSDQVLTEFRVLNAIYSPPREGVDYCRIHPSRGSYQQQMDLVRGMSVSQSVRQSVCERTPVNPIRVRTKRLSH